MPGKPRILAKTGFISAGELRHIFIHCLARQVVQHLEGAIPVSAPAQLRSFERLLFQEFRAKRAFQAAACAHYAHAGTTPRPFMSSLKSIFNYVQK